MFSHIIALWHNNEHGIIALVLYMAQWIKLVSLNFKVAGSNPLTDDFFHLRY